MKRRELLKLTAYFGGATLSAPLLSSLLSGCAVEENSDITDYQLSFFAEPEFAKVVELIDIILPRTDSPSASDVGVHKIIDTMVGTVYSNEAKADYRKGFESLVNFLSKNSDNLSAIKSIENSTADATETVRKAYLDFKHQTVAYYLSTEEIGKKFLNYLPVPGEYKACISLEEAGGKAWAI